VSGTQAIDRAATLLVRLLENEGPATLNELADAADLPKSTASRLMSALERHGLVHQSGERGMLEPGPAILRFAHRGAAERSLLELAEPSLEALSESSRETVNIAVPTPYGVDHLAQVDARHFIGAGQWVGRRVEYDCTANGKVFLAFGAAPVAVPERLARELARVREEEFATAVDELEVGLTAMAAPVRGPAGNVIAALSLSGPTTRLAPERIEELRPVLIEEARALSDRLGYREETAA
jgi:IclR family acetate operon transcriptional repressor